MVSKVNLGYGNPALMYSSPTEGPQHVKWYTPFMLSTHAVKRVYQGFCHVRKTIVVVQLFNLDKFESENEEKRKKRGE